MFLAHRHLGGKHGGWRKLRCAKPAPRRIYLSTHTWAVRARGIVLSSPPQARCKNDLYMQVHSTERAGWNGRISNRDHVYQKSDRRERYV